MAEADLQILQHPRWSALQKSLTIITKHSILDVAVVLDPPLGGYFKPSRQGNFYAMFVLYRMEIFLFQLLHLQGGYLFL